MRSIGPMIPRELETLILDSRPRLCYHSSWEVPFVGFSPMFFISPVISHLYVHHMILVNVKLDASGNERIMFLNYGLHWYSSIPMTQPIWNIGIPVLHRVCQKLDWNYWKLLAGNDPPAFNFVATSDINTMCNFETPLLDTSVLKEPPRQSRSPEHALFTQDWIQSS